MALFWVSTGRGQMRSTLPFLILLLAAPGWAEAQDPFLAQAARSFSAERSGDLFVLPKKYSFIAFRPAYSRDRFAHILKDGRAERIATKGTTHSQIWDYDTHIPLTLWGPGFIRSNLVVDRPVTQQDLVPTIAKLIGSPVPSDTQGEVLSEALKGTSRKPKAVLTVLLDQVGVEYEAAHPQATGPLAKLRQQGTFFRQARVTHLDVETSVGHAAIGTGAYPAEHGIVANELWKKSQGRRISTLAGDLPNSPIWLESPTLADIYDPRTGNKAIIASYCYADRAAIGMAGHGALYEGGDKDLVVFYDEKKGELITNEQYYTLPNYLKDLSPKPYWENLGSPWWGHAVDDPKSVRFTPAWSQFDAEVFTRIITNEAIGQDDVTDLLYMTLKATDACGHEFGYETVECGEVLSETTRQLERIIDSLVQKVGRDNVVVAITADHGSAPMTELTGGTWIYSQDLLKQLNQALDKVDNGLPLLTDVTGSQLYVDQAELRRNKLNLQDIKRHLLTLPAPNGGPLFEKAYTRDEVLRARLNGN